ncbi:MAG TPA: hypothetical protein VMG41_02180 [Gemmatimonadales bacterium]|nr:hypothetical protein [Gemmatimonadales bacterium]
MPQRDVVLRWIEQVARLIARVLYGPGPPDFDLASSLLEDAFRQQVGPLALVLARVDPATGATLLHDPDRIYGYAKLLGLLGAVEQARNDPAAIETASRAVRYAREAIARCEEPPGEWLAWLAHIEAQAGSEDLRGAMLDVPSDQDG